jgi:hypothetical protein
LASIHRVEPITNLLSIAAVYPLSIPVHYLVPALELGREKAFDDTDLQIDAVHINSSGIANRPIRAKDEAILTERSEEKLERGFVWFRISHRLKLN